MSVQPGSSIGSVCGSAMIRSVVVCPSEVLVKPMRGSHRPLGVNVTRLTYPPALDGSGAMGTRSLPSCRNAVQAGGSTPNGS